ncbi:MaoC family dehydratase N-terminal domain-containing protein [Longispora albida]|uniref:MaoC family dehydratase N-terminal domain-containing protein n=1 Tax=Longispora albida TaxID=203523 RepID=UPI00036CD0E5|nr:MaoC family dehydratase N-terminal domain-containing protein [Longispora albida]
MPLDQSLVGTTYPPTSPYEVGREKIREFADAIGDPSPAFREPEAARKLGYPDVIAPPTFPIVLTLDASMVVLEQLGVQLREVLHREQRFEYARPVTAGDQLTCVVAVESIKSLAGNDILTTRTDVLAGEERVVAVWSTLVVRGEA